MGNLRTEKEGKCYDMDVLSPFELASMFQQTLSISTDIALSQFELASMFQQTFSISTTYNTKCHKD